MDVRPHPNPLPQERVNRPAILIYLALTLRLSRLAGKPECGDCNQNVNIFSNGKAFSLSSGERAEVRASLV